MGRVSPMCVRILATLHPYVWQLHASPQGAAAAAVDRVHAALQSLTVFNGVDKPRTQRNQTYGGQLWQLRNEWSRGNRVLNHSYTGRPRLAVTSLIRGRHDGRTTHIVKTARGQGVSNTVNQVQKSMDREHTIIYGDGTQSANSFVTLSYVTVTTKVRIQWGNLRHSRMTNHLGAMYHSLWNSKLMIFYTCGYAAFTSGVDIHSIKRNSHFSKLKCISS